MQPEQEKYKYEYNGKEFQGELGLNNVSLDFRQYNALIGRFNNIDNLAFLTPSISPYRFAYNNPVFWSDPTGLIEESVLKDMFNRSPEGKTTWHNDNNSGFYTDDGGYVGYTSSDTSFNTSPGNQANLPAVNVVLHNEVTYDIAAFLIERNIYKNNKWYNQPSSGLVKGINISLGVVSTSMVYKGKMYLSNEIYHFQKTGKKRFITRWSKTAKGESYWTNNIAKMRRNQYINKVTKLRKFSNKLAYAGIGITIYDIVQNKQVRPSDVINTILLGASTTGIGAIAAGIYFVADFGLYLSTGKGISDRLDENYGPVYSWE